MELQKNISMKAETEKSINLSELKDNIKEQTETIKNIQNEVRNIESKIKINKNEIVKITKLKT
jgi:hypothetical protein